VIMIGEHMGLVTIDPARLALAAVAHLGIHHRDHPVGRHAVTDRRAGPIVGRLVDVLVDDAFQQLPRLATLLMVGGDRQQLAAAVLTSASSSPRRTWATAQSIGALPRTYIRARLCRRDGNAFRPPAAAISFSIA